MRSLPSLRLWLLSAGTLSVVAGYALLLGINVILARQQRLRTHAQLVVALADRRTALEPLARSTGLMGVEAMVLPTGEEQRPVLEHAVNGEAWLTSITPLNPEAASTPSLLVRQNVTDSLAYEHTLQLLLIAAAGVSTLFTTALLRMVLWRGLMRPLNDLSEQLDGLSIDALGQRLIELDDQPQELQSIATAFNNLQQRLAEAWQRERRFVDGVAHELKTPITLISGRSQRLLKEPLTANQTRVLGRIAEEASRMADLISALLELARNDAGRLTLDLQPWDPEQLLVQAFERFEPLAPSRLQLAASTPNGCPRILVDPERLQQCLLALVDNALAYSQSSVLLSVTFRNDPTGSWVSLHVLDRGRGISSEERDRVLERFVRGTSSVGTRGNGIGLSVVRDLTRAMGAELVIADRDDGDGGTDVQMRFRA